MLESCRTPLSMFYQKLVPYRSEPLRGILIRHTCGFPVPSRVSFVQPPRNKNLFAPSTSRSRPHPRGCAVPSRRLSAPVVRVSQARALPGTLVFIGRQLGSEKQSCNEHSAKTEQPQASPPMRPAFRGVNIYLPESSLCCVPHVMPWQTDRKKDSVEVVVLGKQYFRILIFLEQLAGIEVSKHASTFSNARRFSSACAKVSCAPAWHTGNPFSNELVRRGSEIFAFVS